MITKVIIDFMVEKRNFDNIQNRMNDSNDPSFTNLIKFIKRK